MNRCKVLENRIHILFLRRFPHPYGCLMHLRDSGFESFYLCAQYRINPFKLVTRDSSVSKQLKLEREILSKAAAWFAQETVPNSKRSSNS